MAVTLELNEQETLSISVALTMYLEAMAQDPVVIMHKIQGLEIVDISNCKNILQDIFNQMEQRRNNE